MELPLVFTIHWAGGTPPNEYPSKVTQRGLTGKPDKPARDENTLHRLRTWRIRKISRFPCVNRPVVYIANDRIAYVVGPLDLHA